MATKSKLRSILLFEDNSDIVAEFEKEILPFLGIQFELKVFPLSKAPEGTGPYEDRLVAALRTPKYANVALIVTDRDLSLSKWGGLSEAAVSRAAQLCGIPVACYRQATATVEDVISRTPGDGRISLPENRTEQARRAVVLAQGFVSLEKLIKSNVSSARRKAHSSDASDTPGMLLAKLLETPSIGTHFDTYACGAQGAVGEILAISGGDQQDTPHDHRSLISALGVWLADLVMEYPGVLVDEVAAASYLDIHPADFKKGAVQSLFANAIYSDLPFADSVRPLWWRHRLDEIITDSDAVSGLDACSKSGIKRVRFCPCAVDATLHAGYYCMATQVPISAKNSSGRISWFPPGADLARIRKDTYRKLSPWIGS